MAEPLEPLHPLRAIEQTRNRRKLNVLGYVLMPEHVHLLLSKPATEHLAKALQSLKLSVSKHITP